MTVGCHPTATDRGSSSASAKRTRGKTRKRRGVPSAAAGVWMAVLGGLMDAVRAFFGWQNLGRLDGAVARR